MRPFPKAEPLPGPFEESDDPLGHFLASILLEEMPRSCDYLEFAGAGNPFAPTLTNPQREDRIAISEQDLDGFRPFLQSRLDGCLGGRAGIFRGHGNDERELPGTHLEPNVGKRRLVRAEDIHGPCRGRCVGHDHPDREILGLFDECAPGDEPRTRGGVSGEQTRVHDDEAIETVGVLDGQAQADRAAPILDDGGGCVEIEVLDEVGHELDVAVVGVERRVGGFVGHAEAGVVGDDAAVPGCGQRPDDLAGQETPRRLAVEQDDRLAGTLIEVVDADSVDVDVVRLESVAGQVAKRSAGVRMVSQVMGCSHPLRCPWLVPG